MPDYKRLVSYMYTYEEGKKRNNVGYSKVESRNGQCKFIIHASALSYGERTVTIYGFRCVNGRAEGFEIGSGTFKNGVIEFRTVTEPTNIAGSGYAMEDMSGLILYHSDSKYLATCWEEEPITYEQVKDIIRKRNSSDAKRVNHSDNIIEYNSREVVKEVDQKRDGFYGREVEQVKASSYDEEVEQEKVESYNEEVEQEKVESYSEEVEQEKVESYSKEEEQENAPSYSKEVEEEKAPSYSKEEEEKAPTYSKEVEEEKVESYSKDLEQEKAPSYDKEVEEEEAPSYSKEIEEEEVPSYSKEIEEKVASYDKEVEYKEDNLRKHADGIVGLIDSIAENQSSNQEAELDAVQVDIEEAQNNYDTEYLQTASLKNRGKGYSSNEGMRCHDEICPRCGHRRSMNQNRERQNSPEPMYQNRGRQSLPESMYQNRGNNRGYNVENNGGNCGERYQGTQGYKPYNSFPSHSHDKGRQGMNINMEEEPQMIKKVLTDFPRLYPFEDPDVVWCVKIEPKDIRVLPSEVWPLANNSFLLHGFYGYKHLIFGKIRNHNGTIYMLGVPGIYHNRERFMAKMYGFEEFKGEKKGESKDGDFGYWYTKVRV